MAITPSRKCKTVNLRILQEFTVDPPRIPATSSSPNIGMTLSRFKITRAAQNDIFPETTTYPENAVPSEIKKRADPITQTRNFEGVTTVENATALEKCTIVEITTRFAPSMWTSRRSQTKFPWKTIEISSTKFVSSDQARSPRSRNPEMSCKIQHTSATNAML